MSTRSPAVRGIVPMVLAARTVGHAAAACAARLHRPDEPRARRRMAGVRGCHHAGPEPGRQSRPSARVRLRSGGAPSLDTRRGGRDRPADGRVIRPHADEAHRPRRTDPARAAGRSRLLRVAGCSGNVADGGGVRAAGLRVPHRRVRRGDGVRWPLPLINVSLHVESVGGEEAAAVWMES